MSHRHGHSTELRSRQEQWRTTMPPASAPPPPLPSGLIHADELRYQRTPVVLDARAAAINNSISKHALRETATRDQDGRSSFGSSLFSPAHGWSRFMIPGKRVRQRQQIIRPTRSTDSGNATTAYSETAAHFGQQAPLCGYLHKRGQQVTTWKRRFFVLQPATHLYYFLNAQDTEPRGCWDVTTANVVLKDGGGAGIGGGQECMLEISWPAQHDGMGKSSDDSTASSSSPPPIVLLQARTMEQARQWEQALVLHNLPQALAQIQQLQRREQQLQQSLQDLQQQIAHYRHVEQDRDEALQDAVFWKHAFENLDEALRQLTAQVRRPLTEDEEQHQKTTMFPNPIGQDDNAEDDAEEKKADDLVATQLPDGASSSTENHMDAGKATASTVADVGHDDDPRDTSLLDQDDNAAAATDAVGGDGLESGSLDMLQVPGTHFCNLANAVEQLRTNWRLASSEADAALQYWQTLQGDHSGLQSRMGRAEKHLCKLWEENCELRKTAKTTRREKRVLVREVKTLQQQLEDSRAAAAAAAMSAQRNNSTRTPEHVGEHNNDDADEDKLFDELEQHLASSIQLHQQFMAASTPGGLASTSTTPPLNLTTAAAPASLTNDSEHSSDAETSKHSNTVASGNGVVDDSNRARGSIHPAQHDRPISSLLDRDSDDDDEEDDESQSATIPVDESDVSSTGAEASECDSTCTTPSGMLTTCKLERRSNPLVVLDESFDENEKNSCENIVARAPKSRNYATSSLACPLADVVSTQEKDAAEGAPDAAHVYHLTFYSRKIGIQFQKVPPAPVKPRGLLTDALTCDMDQGKLPSNEESTSAELRRVASIFKSAQKDAEKQESLQPSLPKDAVLVCGFEGFDDTGSNIRPKLGARLVAFDGVSVEVGHWKFDSIRKAIQARSRPLTLSFRNDFLTLEQRQILTKAVHEGDPGLVAKRGSLLSRPSSTVPSEMSHESEFFINDNGSSSFRTPTHHHITSSTYQYETDDELSSVASSSVSGTTLSAGNYGMRHSSGARRSSGRRRSSGGGGGGGGFSFSDAGSSTTASILSAVGPLVANLLHQSGGKHATTTNREPFTPDFMTRAPEAVEETPEYQDFRSELL